MPMLLLWMACSSSHEVVSDAPAPDYDRVVKAALLPQAEPMYIAIADGKVAAISATPLQGGEFLEADVVTPGLVDAHAHPAGLGKALAELRLADCTSFADCQERIREAGRLGEGWLIGRGWDQNDWDDHEGFPTAAELDALVPHRPVALRRVDGHAVWLNSKALELSGITADTPPPEGGRILDGVLVDAAMALVEVPEASPQQKKARLEHALSEIRESGLVGVHAMGMSDDTLALYGEVDLPIRIWAYVSPGTEGARRLTEEGPWSDGRLNVVGVKAFADGALGSRGALLTDDYADEAGHKGLAITSTDELAQLATALVAKEAQLAVHAIGDRGVGNTLDAYEAARQAHPDSTVPLRVEHAQVVRPDDIPRFTALNVVASMQPTHATSDMPWAEARLGPDRIPWSYAWKTLLDSGVTMAFGSDFPVEQHSPSYGLWAAMYRNKDALPPDGWYPEQKLDFATTVGLFSEGSYAALGQDGGKIRVGDPADLTLWATEERDLGVWFTATATLVDGQL